MKFKTLVHNGPIFPELYQVKGYKLANEDLSPLAEEMLWAYAAKLETEYVSIDRFNDNFYTCLKYELSPAQKRFAFPIDFMPLLKTMFADNLKLKEEKKALNKKVTKKELSAASGKELEALKLKQKEQQEKEEAKQQQKEKYGFALLNGKKEQLGSFMIEPPGIIMTRGDSSILGMWKYRTVPEDVIINSCPIEKAPEPPAGHKWNKVIANNDSCQTAMYFVQVGPKCCNINPRYKRIIFSATSSVKTSSDEAKFEKARLLVKNWTKVEAYINKHLGSSDKKIKEAALIASLIKITGIRVGNEKSENDGYAETFGVSILCVKHVKLNGNNKVLFSFLGKDSVPYTNEVELDLLTYNCLAEVLKGKKADDLIFSNASSFDVNTFLKQIMPECTPKLFRSAYGCKLIAEELHKAEKNGTLTKDLPAYKKMKIYDEANLVVAKKLNHQRALPKNFDKQTEKIDEQLKISEEKLKEIKEKAMIGIKGVRDEVILAKKTWTGQKLNEALSRIVEKKNKIVARVKKAEERLEKLKDKQEMKSKTANYAISTSRTAYSTPRLAVAFCKKYDLDISCIYSKTLQKKFEWAMDTEVTYFDNFPN